MDTIRERFTQLNPYSDSIPGTILKSEVDALCFAVAAKRYALYTYDRSGLPRLVPADKHRPCAHGLGHLMNPAAPDTDNQNWIIEFWETLLVQRFRGGDGAPAAWENSPTIGQVTITEPSTYRSLTRYNAGKLYRDQIKPFGFLIHAPGADPGGRTPRTDPLEVRVVHRWVQAAA